MYEVTYRATARLDEGDEKAKIVIFARSSYGDRQASVVLEVDDAKLVSAITSALQKAIASVADEGASKARVAAAEGIVEANRRGEKL